MNSQTTKYRRAIFAGTFDPPTLGHIDVLLKVAPLFDKIILIVGTNANKKPLLSVNARTDVLKKIVTRLDLNSNCEVGSWEGLMPEACNKWEAAYLIRGIRNTADLDHELILADSNIQQSGAQTLLVPASKETIYTSSSLVREMHFLGGKTSHMVPIEVEIMLQGLRLPI